MLSRESEDLIISHGKFHGRFINKNEQIHFFWRSASLCVCPHFKHTNLNTVSLQLPSIIGCITQLLNTFFQN